MSARCPYTRWDRDRGGKLVLRQDTYRVIGRSRVLERGLALRDAAMVTLASAAWFTVILLMALSYGCAQPASPETGPVPCELALDVPEELRDVAYAAADRMYDATGCVLDLDPSGVPVSHESSVVDADGNAVCGVTEVGYYDDGEVDDVYDIQLNWELADCPPAETDLLHETIHALSNPKGAQFDGSHAASGLFAAKPLGGSLALNADTLGFLCSHANCVWFQPEDE